MRHLIVLLVAAIGVVAASPLHVQQFREKLMLSEENTRNNALEELVLALIEEIRELMVTGSDTIPVLDPLTIDSIHVDQNTIAIIPGHVTINDLTVNSLSTFEIHEFGIGMVSLLQQRYRVILDASIPVLDASAGSTKHMVVLHLAVSDPSVEFLRLLIVQHLPPLFFVPKYKNASSYLEEGKTIEHQDKSGYDLDLNILGGSIFGSGDATLKIVRPRLRANVVMSIRLSGGIFIQLSDVDIRVSLEAFEPRITGLFNDPDISDFISVFLKNLVEEILQFFEEEINEFISDIVLVYGNEILANLDLGGIIGGGQLI